MLYNNNKDCYEYVVNVVDSILFANSLADITECDIIGYSCFITALMHYYKIVPNTTSGFHMWNCHFYVYNGRLHKVVRNMYFMEHDEADHMRLFT